MNLTETPRGYLLNPDVPVRNGTHGQELRDIGGLPLLPLSLHQYHAMIQAKIIDEDDPVELIDGYLVLKDQGKGPGMGHGPIHALEVTLAHDVLRAALSRAWVVRCQLPVTLGTSPAGGGQEPEPDVTVADGPLARYVDHHPGPTEIRLLVEVADSSLLADRKVKGELYAESAIPLYWIINLVNGCLEVYSSPDVAARKYQSKVVLEKHETVTLSWEGLPPMAIPVKEFFAG